MDKLELEGEMWTAENLVPVLVEKDGKAIHIVETLLRGDLIGRNVKVTIEVVE